MRWLWCWCLDTDCRRVILKAPFALAITALCSCAMVPPADARSPWTNLSGLMTAEDLASYRAVLRPPLNTSYKNFQVLTHNLPTSGGVVLSEILHLLETTDFRSNAGLDFNAVATYAHLMHCPHVVGWFCSGLILF